MRSQKGELPLNGREILVYYLDIINRQTFFFNNIMFLFLLVKASKKACSVRYIGWTRP